MHINQWILLFQWALINLYMLTPLFIARSYETVLLFLLHEQLKTNKPKKRELQEREKAWWRRWKALILLNLLIILSLVSHKGK